MTARESDVALLARLLRERRTVSQGSLSTTLEPNHTAVLEALESARWAPNHHLTEPWRFYLLDPARIARLGELWADVQARKGAKPEKVARKRQEWGESKGVLILTCTSAPDASEVDRKEDYAACCCAAQNLMLHLWAEGLGSKWSTGAVWEHEAFWPLLGHSSAPDHTEVVGVFFYGVPERVPEGRRKKGLDEVLIDFRAQDGAGR
jgi:nitroreductase